VINNLVAYAYATGEVRMQSDGSPWRPFAHVEDIARGFLAALEAPREAIHDEAFNIGRDEDNHQIRAVAAMVEQTVPGATVTLADGAGPDTRTYRVSFEKVRRRLPAFAPQWTVRRGIEELLAAYREHGLTIEDFLSSRFQRIMRIRELLDAGRLGEDLRWT
jgi:nucleoside-diphosphate-sugar epimerase